MEGACGKILETEQVGVVVKRIHRHISRGSQPKGLGAKAQCAMQEWASALLTEVNGFSVLFTPRAWLDSEKDSDKNEYSMRRIDCSDEINPCALPVRSSEGRELRLFYEKAQVDGIFPCDYELYRQSDGRIALIDFDKFGRWKQGSGGDEVILPWGATIFDPIYPWSN